MARIRSIHPESCESDKLARLSDVAERTYWRLLTQADDEGRGRDVPELLAARLYPLDASKDAEVIDAVMEELAENGNLRRYTVGGKPYYEIHDFTDWQKPRHPSPSKYPTPEEDDGTVTAERRTPTAKRRKAPALVGEGVGEGGVAPEASGRRPSGVAERSSGPRDDVDSLCDLLVELIVANGCRKPSVTKQWRDEARRLLDKDGVERGEAERVMRWALADSFWRTNVLSMPTFREKFDRLRMQSEARLRAVEHVSYETPAVVYT